MNIIEKLAQEKPLLELEQQEIDRRLASAYATDETAAKTQEVDRLAEKVRSRLESEETI